MAPPAEQGPEWHLPAGGRRWAQVVTANTLGVSLEVAFTTPHMWALQMPSLHKARQRHQAALSAPGAPPAAGSGVATDLFMLQ